MQSDLITRQDDPRYVEWKEYFVDTKDKIVFDSLTQAFVERDAALAREAECTKDTEQAARLGVAWMDRAKAAEAELADAREQQRRLREALQSLMDHISKPCNNAAYHNAWDLLAELAKENTPHE